VAPKPNQRQEPSLELYRHLVHELPVTLRPSMNQQIDQWNTLFPFEQTRLSGMMDRLASLSRPAFEALIAPVRAVEGKMGVRGWDFSESEDTIENASLLARSAYYAEWRARVEEFFEAVNLVPDSKEKQKNPARLILMVLPASLPTDPKTVWKQWDRRGRAVRISGDAEAILTLLMDGQPAAQGIVELLQSRESNDPSSLWLIDTGATQPKTLNRLSPANASILEFGALKPLRDEFLAELNKAPKNIEITDQVRYGLRRKSWEGLWPRDLGGQPRLQRFIVDLFLSGNGAVIFPNSFVEWAASEAIRRARPRVVIARFGMRIKPKPFTSIAVFENQQKVSSVPDADDPDGSAIDAAILARYVWLAASRYPEMERTCCVCVAESPSSAYVFAPAGTDYPWGTQDSVQPGELCNWIGTQLSA
jgi:hypothetical protein